MTQSQEQTLAEARNYVSDLFTNKVDPQLVFHSLVHTEDVAEACSQMSEINKLSDDDHFILLMSAWFHDTGYSTGQAEGHEEVSIQLCKDFLQKHNVDDTFIQKISSCIAATKMPQSPVSQVEKILCDADLMHLSTEDFKARNELLKQEREYLIGKKIDKKEWRKNNISFLQHHKYFTEYGQQTLEPGKLINNNLLKKKKKSKQEIVPEHTEEAFPYVFSDKPVLDLKTVQKNAERGIQTMFRTTSSNHFELSSLADSKANIMISVNSIIISVALTVLLARLAFYPEYTVPTLILLVVCLAAIIFAILATRPSVNKGRFTEDDIRNKTTNLLFFGNFHRMKLEEYNWAMNEMMKDSGYLYDSMIKDIYFLGVVLAKKYKYLRISYTIFMWGIIAAVIAFAIAAIYGGVSGGGSSAPLIDY